MKKQMSNNLKAGKQKGSSPDMPTSSQDTQSSPSPIPNDDPFMPPTFQSATSQSKAPKVAIARLPRQNAGQPTSKALAAADKNRVAHACEPCRHRKTKCSGERPECQHCQDFNLTCFYADGKRDRTRKQLGSLAGRVYEYERILKDLSTRAGLQDQDLIRKTLDREQLSDDDDPQNYPRGRTRDSNEQPGEEKVSARIGSTESMDRIGEDFNRGPDARATGYHGKNSELTWVRKLKSQAVYDSSEDGDEPGGDMAAGDISQTSGGHRFDTGTGVTPISASSYHCDDLTLFLQEEIDPYELPNQAAANELFQCYLTTVHPSFPIIGKTTFVQQYNAYFNRLNQRKPNQNWLAILNIIFAIGARYSHLVRAESGGDTKDHLVYFTRARILGFNAHSILGHADLQRVQTAGLMAFYLMAVNQINRSWTVSGVAIRHATTLGLNLRNESGDVSDGSKEIRYRVWWALCSTERLLAVMTGRPVSFAEHNCTAPLPLPLEEDSFFLPGTQTSQALQMMRRWSSQESRQSDIAMTTTSEDPFQKKSPSSSLSPAAFSPPSQDQEQYFPPCDAMAFGYQTELSLFSNEVLNRLYRAAGMLDSWAHVQATISSLNAKLHSWRQKLPPVFDFDEKEQDQQFAFQRKSLGFSYYSMLIIINRPCLCRIDRKTPDQSDESKISSKEAATRCVHAARGMLDLLPDEPDGIVLFQIAPWWCLVHWLMQAAVVSMLELSFRADHMPNEVEEVFDSAKKALKWLRNMSERDEAARRASTLCDDLLRHVAPKVGKSVTETPEHSNTAVEDTQNMQYKTSIDPYRGEGNPQSIQYPQVGRSPLNQFQFQSGYFTSGTFQPQFSTSYDQVLAYGQLPSTSAQAPYDEMFPTAMELDGMVLDENRPGYSWGQDQNWFPGSGI